MSYNGSGTFQINTSGQPVVTGTSISSTVFNALTADLATGLSTAITKDGQTTTTARIPFALGINSTLVTDATNTTSGSIITAGGVGIAKALFVGTTANIAGVTTVQAGTAALPAITTSGDTNTGIFFPAADTIGFSKGGAEVARFDSSGNFGLGVTPSAWFSGTKAVQLLGATFTSTASTGYLYQNSYLDTNTVEKYYADGFASKATLSSGGHQWFTSASSGTAGNNITFIQAMTLDASGRLIVGGSNINGRIQSITPASYTESSFRADSATAASTNWNHFYGTSSSNSVANIIIYGNGNIVNANNSYGPISDIKLKENIVDATPKLDNLMKVRIVNYNLKTDPELKQIGVIAQELEQVFAGLVDEHPDRDTEGNDLGTTTKSVKMSVFIPMLIKAIQEQQALITTLTDRITALEARNG